MDPEYDPAGQDRHAAEELAAAVAEYFPVLHEVQESMVIAVLTEYFPATQEVQVSVVAAPEYFPAAHA